MSSARSRTFLRKRLRLACWPSSRFRESGFGFAGRVANLESGPGGDEKQFLCGAELPSTGERGGGARMGEDERGEGAAGR